MNILRLFICMHPILFFDGNIASIVKCEIWSQFFNSNFTSKMLSVQWSQLQEAQLVFHPLVDNMLSGFVPVQMTGSRMKIAGRFRPCAHMGCFDLESFVELNQRSRKVTISSLIFHWSVPSLAASLIIFLGFCAVAMSNLPQEFFSGKHHNWSVFQPHHFFGKFTWNLDLPQLDPSIFIYTIAFWWYRCEIVEKM